MTQPTKPQGKPLIEILTTRPITEDLIHAFVDELTTITQGTITYDTGPKHVRVVSHLGGSSCAYCFIDNKTGDIYKPASWRGPIKNVVRGNIHDETWRKWCGKYGIRAAK